MEESLTKTDELRRVRAALLNILEDTDELRRIAVDEKNKTMVIIENLTDGVILLNKENKIEIINSPALDFLSIRKKEITGKYLVDFLLKEEFSQVKEALIDEDKKRIKSVYKKEVLIGNGLFVEITSVLLKDEKEEKGFLVVIHDVTKASLVEKMKTEFVSIAAHQLRTPLSAIKWTVGMILDGDVGEINEEQKDLLEKTYISNERMIHLINDLLNVTRIEEGRLLYNQERGQLEKLTEEILSGFEETLKMKNISLEIKKSEEVLPSVKFDKEKMSLALQNLIENAIKYTQNNGSIKIFLEKDEKNVTFKIKDSGVGIPKNQRERIFSKFFRGENVVKMETEGTGLGLYTTKNIINAHKGEIWFEPDENKGTTFYFTIPIMKNN
jgi:PAS domain S-box-containing protein